MAPSHIRRSQGPPFDENAFLKGLETLSQTDKEKEAGHNALRSRTCATFGPPLYSAARGRRRRRQSKGSDQNKILKHQHLEHPIFPLKVPPLHRTTILPGERKRNNKEKCKALALLVQKSQNAKTSLSKDITPAPGPTKAPKRKKATAAVPSPSAAPKRSKDITPAPGPTKAPKRKKATAAVPSPSAAPKRSKDITPAPGPTKAPKRSEETAPPAAAGPTKGPKSPLVAGAKRPLRLAQQRDQRGAKRRLGQHLVSEE
ncbi:unnamed protein product [Cladocopium goreaui]|uniref:Uncharacterized protein n=1 Tax=Cladocopium goreaui TaxID=2562237 RepID=A0A9P1BFH7_9DINO|nr:unnamed protein product [Cladocopium goreaui]